MNDWDPRFRYPQYEFFVNPNVDEAPNGLPILIGKIEAADGDRGDVVVLSLRGADARFSYFSLTFYTKIQCDIINHRFFQPFLHNGSRRNIFT